MCRSFEEPCCYEPVAFFLPFETIMNSFSLIGICTAFVQVLWILIRAFSLQELSSILSPQLQFSHVTGYTIINQHRFIPISDCSSPCYVRSGFSLA
ncbi:hypothetical protein ARMGADRAFT_684108 [Armillaria gallica]|uniref:Uncharacterized protein n=1 Tax=Armillaria gallica TaxID=47427 RepID=A0A2H3CM80_ARMGA|nr:hypothetical protein ARMGADRAFT_684108 [Armillaria gallica]